MGQNGRIFVHDGTEWHGLHKFVFPPNSDLLTSSEEWYAFLRGVANRGVKVDGDDAAFLCTIYNLDKKHFKLAQLPLAGASSHFGLCPTCYGYNLELILIPCGSVVPHRECRLCHFTWYNITATKHGEGRCALGCGGTWVYPISRS